MSLVESDNKLEQKPIEEIDPFSRLMFGNNKHKRTNKKDDMPEHKEQLTFERKTNRFDDWIFGNRGKAPLASTQTILNKDDMPE
ncbi:hypothetical protein V7266_29190, partial [Neobacillus drentensis]|uniref:hypothetical protein n=1 Tax=Neobacillus drentensis TaxID=220684 RepID=UPI00300043DE